ncbi:MAG TPA: glycosyltransferase family 2 protein [bacterium]|nr:glycosyltransferase family 2 protein [bacterium]
MEITTVIFVHHGTNEARSELARRSLNSLIESLKLPCELFVIDNGGNVLDSHYFVDLTEQGKITHYIRNSDNLWFGYARNQALRLSIGNYIAIMDNDLLYEDGWLEECIEVLKETKGQKLLVTPLEVDRAHLKQKYFLRQIKIGDKSLWVNSMAGSNCWVMHAEDCKEIGEFQNHVIAGTKWIQTYCRKEYGVVVLPEPKASHFGLRGSPYYGYSKKNPDKNKVKMIKTFTNGEQIQLN